MAKEKFNTVAIGLVYSGVLQIPETHPLYEEAHELHELVRKGLSAAGDVPEDVNRMYIQSELEQLFPNANLPRFTAALQFYCDGSGKDLSFEDRLEHVGVLADLWVKDGTPVFSGDAPR